MHIGGLFFFIFSRFRIEYMQETFIPPSFNVEVSFLSSFKSSILPLYCFQEIHGEQCANKGKVLDLINFGL